MTQVASSDGRVLVYGQDGVEQTLPSPTSVATAGLLFLPCKDSLLRITTVCPKPVLSSRLRHTSQPTYWTELQTLSRMAPHLPLITSR